MTLLSFIKRSIDIVVCLMVLPVTICVLIIAIALLKIVSGGPIFFIQYRLGLGGRAFKIIKLRTMTVDPRRDVTRDIDDSDPAVLPIGRVFRRYKIDELPQLVNVLLGDMSLVGPRPLPVEMREKVPDWAMCRFDVRPGMTGAAQVNGNVTLSFDERLRHDVEYVATMGFVVDISILLKTAVVLCLGEGRFRREANKDGLFSKVYTEEKSNHVASNSGGDTLLIRCPKEQFMSSITCADGWVTKAAKSSTKG